MREDRMRAEAIDLVDDIAGHVRTREHHPELDRIHARAQAFKDRWSRVGNLIDPDTGEPVDDVVEP